MEHNGLVVRVELAQGKWPLGGCVHGADGVAPPKVGGVCQSDKITSLGRMWAPAPIRRAGWERV